MKRSNNMTATDTKKQRGWGIATKLIVSFSALFISVTGAIGLVDLYGMPFTRYTGTVGHAEEDAFEKLNLVADFKKTRLERWLKERKADITVFADNEFVIDAVSRIHRSTPASKEVGYQDYKNLLEFMNLIKKTYGVYNRIWIADVKRGTIFISTDKKDLGRDVSELAYFKEALWTAGVYTSDITRSAQSGFVSMRFSKAVEDERGEVLAVMVMNLDPDEILRPFLHTGEGLGEWGEALLINRDVRVLTTLKHPLADGTMAKPLEYRIEAEPARRAAAGQEGIVESADYRGVLVLAAYRYIPVSADVGWGIVVKVDKSEMFSFIRESINYTLVIGTVGMIAIVTLIIILVKKFTGPIVSLSKTAQKVASGDLGARATVTTQDEVGVLASAFNEMVAKVQNWRGDLEEIIGKRTSKLQAELFERAKIDKELIRHRDHLEELVKEKTKELDEKIVKLDKGQKAMLYMVEDLNATRNDLKKSSDELEKRVEVRTSELQAEIIERNMAEEELEKAFKELDFTHKQFVKSQIQLIQSEKMNAVGTMVAGVAHELNNPMMGILNYVQYCRKHTAHDDKRHEILGDAEFEVKRCVSIVDNLLTFSHMEKEGKEDPVRALCSVILERVFKLVDHRIKKERVSVEKRYAPDVPDVLIRQNRIQQVFLNLINNALDALKESEKKEITVEVRREKGYIAVTVADTGSGIAPEDLEHIFEPFFTTKPTGTGTGLGLSVTKSIVEDEGGTISCESKLGEGATFTVKLPIDEGRGTKDVKSKNKKTKDDGR